MLILTRRIGEVLRIGDDVSLMVVGVQGNQVRIGADAPKEIAIHREEIYRRIQQEKNGETEAPRPSPRKSVQNQASPRIDSQPSSSTSSTGTRFYSTEGTPRASKKTPNVIVKKKRVYENV